MLIADDIVLVNEIIERLRRKLDSWIHVEKERGLKLVIRMREYLIYDFGPKMQGISRLMTI